MLKLLLVYLHLLAVCVSLGSILLTDHKLWRWRRRALDAAMLAHLDEIQRVVTLALVALWISGVVLIGVGYASEGNHYLLNQKLWAKVLVVVVLTINGVLLHRLGFPLLRQAPLVELARADRVRLGLLGAVSGSSWLFAAFLGVARMWNHTLSCAAILAIFAAGLLLAAMVATAVMGLVLQGRRGGSRDFKNRDGSMLGCER